MGRSMFDKESDYSVLISVLNSLNEKLSNAKKLKTVEEIQKVIDQLNIIVSELKKTVINY